MFKALATVLLAATTLTATTLGAMSIPAMVFVANLITPTANAEEPRVLAPYVVFGTRCVTQYGWSYMVVPAPVGSSCFVATQYGPVTGYVSP